MRETKFRAWVPENEILITGPIWTFILNSSYDDRVIVTDHVLQFEVYPESIMQYTGLRDKNGVGIYEGDICKVSGEEPYNNDYFSTDYDWEMVMFVDFKYGAFQLREKSDNHISFYFIETQDMEIKVIGNIFENPELIEED